MTTTSAHRRSLIVPKRVPRESEASQRRYQLARQRVASLRRDADGPFAHLRRTYD